MINMRVLLLVLGLLGPANASALNSANNQHSQELGLDVDVLAINDEVKTLLDTYIKPVHGQVERVEALHMLLFHDDFLGIDYDSAYTKTAQETYDSRLGNCLSLANLFVAAARYLDLPAKFQSVTVPRRWERSGQFYIVPGHVNVHIKTRSKKILVELLATYYDTPQRKLHTEIISDEQALADYFSNLGVEALERQEYSNAVAYLEKSTRIYPKDSVAWSNLGVAYKLANNFSAAEQAYIRALSIHKNNTSAINNIYALYTQMGEEKKAEKYKKIVERNNRRNPYHYAKLAQSKIESKDYIAAIKQLEKAIRLNPNEASFYHSMAIAYYHLQDYELLVESIEKAKSAAKTQQSAQRYQAKLEAILTSL